MIPSRPIDWVTRRPVIENVEYPLRHSFAAGDVYRPAGGGRHPGVFVCLGVVPFDIVHPQVARLGAALARSGFAALLHWSPAMRDLRLDPEDIEDFALAYQWFIEQPYVDPARSGILGTCVGGSFALMAAAHPAIRDHIGFVCAYAPYSSMWTFARDIASRTRSGAEGRKPWKVDQLTRKVFVRSLTAVLEEREAELLRKLDVDYAPAPEDLSEMGRAIYPLLTHLTADEADTALQHLPPVLQERLRVMSPVSYLRDIHAPVIVLAHDRGDLVVPVDESRRLYSALSGRSGVNYTELRFQHLDPSKLPIFRLMRELWKFYFVVYRLFRQTAA